MRERCPHCGQIMRQASLAKLVKAAIGPGVSNVSLIKSRIPQGYSNKEIYNALTYLTRCKFAKRVGYGLYELLP